MTYNTTSTAKTRVQAPAHLVAVVLFCLLALALLPACSKDQGQDGNDTPTENVYTDSLGRSVILPLELDRVAAADATSQQAILAIAADKIAGLAEELDSAQAKCLGLQANDLPVYGQLHGGAGVFSHEQLVAADPQAIIDIGPSEEGLAEDLDDLQELTGVPVVHINGALDSYGNAFKALGDLLGAHERGREVANYYDWTRSDVMNVLKGIGSSDTPRVAYLLGDDGLSTMPENSTQATVVDAVCTNVMKLDPLDIDDEGTPVSFEQLALWNPDMIIFASQEAYSTLPAQKRWQELDAISNEAYCKVPDTPCNWLSSPAGPNQLLGLIWLANTCYPDRFDSSLKSQVKAYFKSMYGCKLSTKTYKAMLKGATPKSTGVASLTASDDSAATESSTSSSSSKATQESTTQDK